MLAVLAISPSMTEKVNITSVGNEDSSLAPSKRISERHDCPIHSLLHELDADSILVILVAPEALIWSSLLSGP